MRRRWITALTVVLVLSGVAPGLLGGPGGPGALPAVAAEGGGPRPDATPSPSPTPSPAPSTPAPAPAPAPVAPSPRPSPTPEPSPTEDCLAGEEGTVSFGDVDRDCDGTLRLSEQGEPISIDRTVELAPQDLPAGEAEGVGETEDRFEPTDFVPGVLVGFDETSEQGGMVREGSLVYTPPAGFVGEDRYTFLVRGEDGITREAEVVVDVRYADLRSPGEGASATPVGPTAGEDAVDRALRALPGTDEVVEVDQRWEPPWLALLLTIAGLLLSVAIAWWMFLVVRIQERRRQE